MRSFKVRLATPADIDDLVHQRHMMFADMKRGTSEELKIGDRAFRRWALEKMKKRLLRCYLVTDSEGRVVAGGAVWLREQQPGPMRRALFLPYLMSMYTEPSYRRRGLASMVVREATEWARTKGYPRMSLHASKDGRKVYSKLGWERSWEMRVDFERRRPGRKEPTAARARSSRPAE